MNVFFPILGGLSTTQHLSTLSVDKFSTSSTSLRTQPYSKFIYPHKWWTTFPQPGMAGDNPSNLSTHLGITYPQPSHGGWCDGTVIPITRQNIHRYSTVILSLYTCW